jgi:hypothetical protein
MRDKRLTVEIVDGELRISIGVETLAEVVDSYCGFEVVDVDTLAVDVAKALCEEEDDEKTEIHRLLDEAFAEAAENGSKGLIEI